MAKAAACATERKLTLCVGDRVERNYKFKPADRKRLLAAGHLRGEVVAIEPGRDNNGRVKMAARVRFDGDEPNDRPYPWLFVELRKIR